MSDRTNGGAVPTDSDADAVRIVARDARGRRTMLVYQAVALFLVACSVGYALTPRRSTPAPPSDEARPRLSPMDKAIAEAVREEKQPGQNAAGPPAPARITTASGRSMTPRHATPPPPRPKEPEPEGDTSPDLRDFIPPGEKPTAGEVIEELHKRGIYEGIGAFNPPGTSPPLVGLEVPDDFELPEGYVRHYQATDDGQRIRPILMFSPDFEFFDENGQPITIPEDRVVPPELAPPGFPIRDIQIPPNREERGSLGR